MDPSESLRLLSSASMYAGDHSVMDSNTSENVSVSGSSTPSSPVPDSDYSHPSHEKMSISSLLNEEDAEISRVLTSISVGGHRIMISPINLGETFSRSCTNCRSRKTSQWRRLRINESLNYYCNPCYLHYKTKKEMRQVDLNNFTPEPTIKKRRKTTKVRDSALLIELGLLSCENCRSSIKEKGKLRTPPKGLFSDDEQYVWCLKCNSYYHRFGVRRPEKLWKDEGSSSSSQHSSL